MDAVDIASGINDFVDAGGVVFGKGGGAVAIDTDGGGGDVDDATEFCDEYGMAVVFCVVWWDYAAGTEIGEVFLWCEETGGDWIFDIDDCGGDDDDITNHFVPLWDDVASVGGSEFVDITDTAVGDGAYVYDGCGGWGAVG